MEPTGYLIILLILFILWVFQFAQLMTLGDDVFPTRYDKALWVAAFVVAFPAAPFAFLWWKQIMVALKAEEKKQSAMDLKLSGQVAVVVGAARGIGRAIAAEFAAEQAAVALLDRDQEVIATASQLPGSALGIEADVCDYAAMQEAAKRIRRERGRIDHVVYAAGLGSGKFGFPFWNLTPGDWPKVLEVNIQGAVHTAHAFSPALIEKRSGTMLFISSVAGQIGSQTDPPYSAAKAALINFAQLAAKDLAPHGVRVNTICPGMVKTTLNKAVWEAWNRQQPDEQKRSYDDWANEKVQKVVPLGRWQDPEDIAAMAVFLASSRGKNITGQTINVDGGFVMHW